MTYGIVVKFIKDYKDIKIGDRGIILSGTGNVFDIKVKGKKYIDVHAVYFKRLN